MRIISGSHRGRRITAPANLPVRPTTDLAKESLFNILWNHFDIEEIRVLDLFSGTGNLTYEFASRGAKEVVAVDIDTRCTRFIIKMAEELSFRQVRVIRADVFNYLKHRGEGFDVIFADPPYDMDNIIDLPVRIMEGNWLNPEGWFIIEHSAFIGFSAYPGFFDVRKYGKVHFSFFKKEG
ncbi:MAG: 16S rRNA (guanine(966)-N(2))-methyltransferase RsmD [Bacteroidetes bacterium]|nr:16S rRNA (guanine(966)-N(2))-methyltransferase RsmD [Bacteroidota bacterium]